MMLGKLRVKYQKAIAPVGKTLAKFGFSPNSMTITSLFVAIISGYVYTLRMPTEAALLIILTGVIDMFDGAIARTTGRVTNFGATFDHVVDRYAEFFVIIGIIYAGYTSWISGFFTLFGMLMASFTRAKAESVGGLKSCTVGIAERQEKLLLIIGGSLLLFMFSQSLNYAIIIVGILSHITVLQRLHYTWVQTGGK
jgi:CDP-diacylglycerol--glycerol-3-phosphate 3-phosphatidyltransferase/archaetidylinositol phosphate synthase